MNLLQKIFTYFLNIIQIVQRFSLYIIVALAFSFRMLMLFTYLPYSPWVADMVLDDAEMGRNLLAGRGWVENVKFVERVASKQHTLNKQIDLVEFLPAEDNLPGVFKPFTTYSHTPGYSAWFAISYFLGGSQRYIYSQIMQAALDTFACVVIFVIGKNIANRSVGLIAAFIYALSPAHAFLANLPVAAATDSFWTLLVSLGAVKMWLAVKNRQPALKGLLVMTIGVLGGSVMNSSIFILPLVYCFAACLIYLIKRKSRKFIFYCLSTQLLVVFLLIPWGIRNLRVNGHFSLIRETTGQFMWEAWGDLPNPWGLASEDDGPYWRWVNKNCYGCTPWEREKLTQNFLIKNVIFSREFFPYLSSAISQKIPKLSLLILTPGGRINLERSMFYQLSFKILIRIANNFLQYIFTLSALGILIQLIRKRFSITFIAIVPSLYIIIFCLIFFMEFRKIVPGFGLLFILSAVAIDYILFKLYLFIKNILQTVYK